MALKIKGNEVYDHNGKWLKTITCPRKVKLGDLDAATNNNFSCQFCKSMIYNTDFMNEDNIQKLIKDEPTACLLINMKNPLFERID